MIKLETILENWSEWEMEFDDRFGRRLTQFLSIEDLEKIGYSTSDTNHSPIPWTEENVLAQLKEDIEFAWEKACNKRNLSACLMVSVIQRWCDALENKLEYDPDYTDYGKSFIHEVDQYYGWHLTDKDVAEED